MGAVRADGSTLPPAGPSARALDAAPNRPETADSVWQAPLGRFVRALWVSAPALQFGDAGPFIVGTTIHLPCTPRSSRRLDRPAGWHWYRAAAAHAAAHLAYSPKVFDGRGLGPIARALLGLLEDARVEALACRELPGLRRLWAPLHTVTPLDGDGLETLLLRLARALFDSTCDDPHPWVRKGRALVFLDPANQVLALRRPDELRHAASLLGHDIGQMRLQLNARLHLPGPDYRDDGRWMWPAPAAVEPELARPQPRPTQTRAGGDAAPAETPPTPHALHYPEWDRLIARLRPDWCAVIETPPESGAQPAPADARADQAAAELRGPLRRALQHAARQVDTRTETSREGDRLDPDALVRARIAGHAGSPVDWRVHLRPRRARRGGRTLMLIDQSASSAAPWGATGLDLLQAARLLAAAAGTALQTLGTRVAVGGFCSNGRHEVRWRSVKPFASGFDAAALARLAALQPQHSTRLGAAIRHAMTQLGGRDSLGPRQLLVIGDGLPHDVDVHDPRYLVEDARHAVLQARGRGLIVHCIVLDAGGLAVARRIFGARQVALLARLDDLPALVRRLGL